MISELLRCFSLAKFRKNTFATNNTSYINAHSTIRAAQAKGLSVSDYIELIWNQQGSTDRVIEEMLNTCDLTMCDRVCEIGPGTGRYLDRLLKHKKPAHYEIYETADDWAKWLERTYSPTVVNQSADGRTLRYTPDRSCGLVHAHGVFVYIPLLNTFEYFIEMARVCTPTGFVAFDFFCERDFTIDQVEIWLKTNDRYPVVLPYTAVLDFFNKAGFRRIHEFSNKYGHGNSRYVIFKNDQ